MAIMCETVNIFGGWKRVPEGFPGGVPGGLDGDSVRDCRHFWRLEEGS